MLVTHNDSSQAAAVPTSSCSSRKRKRSDTDEDNDDDDDDDDDDDNDDDNVRCWIRVVSIRFRSRICVTGRSCSLSADFSWIITASSLISSSAFIVAGAVLDCGENAVKDANIAAWPSLSVVAIVVFLSKRPLLFFFW